MTRAKRWNADELLQFLVLLLLAGNETTTNLIGNGMLALGRNPESMAALRAKPDLMRGAVEEMLRYDGPVQATFRTATKRHCGRRNADQRGHGRVRDHRGGESRSGAIQGSRKVWTSRANLNDQVAFGEGIHFCIGAPLARMEGSIAIGQCARTISRIFRLKNPDAPVTYKGSYFLRGAEPSSKWRSSDIAGLRAVALDAYLRDENVRVCIVTRDGIAIAPKCAAQSV